MNTATAIAFVREDKTEQDPREKEALNAIIAANRALGVHVVSAGPVPRTIHGDRLPITDRELGLD